MVRRRKHSGMGEKKWSRELWCTLAASATNELTKGHNHGLVLLVDDSHDAITNRSDAGVEDQLDA